MPEQPVEREIPFGNGEPWSEALSVWDERRDLRRARRAVKLFEQIATREASSPHASVWCARALYFVADYQEDEAKRRDLFWRGAEHGRSALELAAQNAGALFWCGACLGSYAQLVNIVRRASLAPEIFRYVKQVWDIDPGYYDRGPARFLGQAMVREPLLVAKLLTAALPEIGPEATLGFLRESIAEDPPRVFTNQTLGQLAYATSRDKETVRLMREAIETIDLDATPAIAPENHRDLPRARRLLDELL